MIAQRLRAIGQNRFMRAAVGIQVYNVSAKNVRRRLCIALTFSGIMLLACGAYGGSMGHVVGRTVVQIWEVKHNQPMDHEWIVVHTFIAFYILLMTTGSMGVVGYIVLLLTKRYYLHASYVNLKGKRVHIAHDDIRENLWVLTVVCVLGGIAGGLLTLFGMSSFIDYVTR